MMLIEESVTWGSFVNRFKNFSDEHLLEEIEVLEKAIDSDFMKDSLLFDAVLSLYDFSRDECVRRLATKSQ